MTIYEYLLFGTGHGTTPTSNLYRSQKGFIIEYILSLFKFEVKGIVKKSSAMNHVKLY